MALPTTLLITAYCLWPLVENGLLRGTAGENRFGPDPLPTENRAPE
jgi:uncharacterized membrane protein YhaH (DUF805 family)